MVSDRRQILVLVSDGRISAAQAERMLFPAGKHSSVEAAIAGAFWSVLAAALVALLAATMWDLHAAGMLESAARTLVSALHGPTAARHFHAILSNLFGGFL